MPNNILMLVFMCIGAGVIGYLLGSINFGIIICKLMFKEDVRTKGSGNAGMTNVLRTYGKKGAILTLLGDVAKGIVAVVLGRLLFALLAPQSSMEYGAFSASVMAVVGHMLPVFFGFKGGKSVAVTGGVIIGIQPLLALPLLAIFLVCVAFTGMVSLGSVLGISLYPVITLFYSRYAQWPVIFCTICAALVSGLVIFMHRANIKRILAGTEYRFGKRFKKPEDTEIKKDETDVPC